VFEIYALLGVCGGVLLELPLHGVERGAAQLGQYVIHERIS
jgi:hypothetical protein